jgi:hypothetical protein
MEYARSITIDSDKWDEIESYMEEVYDVKEEVASSNLENYRIRILDEKLEKVLLWIDNCISNGNENQIKFKRYIFNNIKGVKVNSYKEIYKKSNDLYLKLENAVFLRHDDTYYY